MQTVPVQALPVQTLKAVLGGQNCQIGLAQHPQGLFCDVTVEGVLFVAGIIARDTVPIVCRTYLGFIGNLFFIDTMGNDDPEYSGLGSRWQLIYITSDEYAVFVDAP